MSMDRRMLSEKFGVRPRGYTETRKLVLQWLGPKIRNRLQESDLSLTALSKETGIGISTLSDYISGRYEPSLSKIMCLASALGVNWRFFFEKDYLEPDVGFRQEVSASKISNDRMTV